MAGQGVGECAMPRQGWQDELAKEGDDSAQTPGRPFFGYFLVAVDKK